MKFAKLKCIPAIALCTLLSSAAWASTTRYVNGVSGSDSNACTSPTTACKTIGHAISLASSGNSIMVAAATYTENLTIGFSLTVIGSGAAMTIIDGGGTGTVVTIPNANAHVTLSKVKVRNGPRGVSNNGTLTINSSTISGNSATGPGGGIFNNGALTLNTSTISGNIASGGGGIYSEGTLTVNTSTISGNQARVGGGISNDCAGIVTINNSTISGNIARGGRGDDGGGIHNQDCGGMVTINNSTRSGNSAGFGGGIAGLATLQNSIVANSPSGGNCSGTMTSNGYNLSSDGSCDFDGSGDLNNTNPRLGPLQNNGGPTLTMALLPGSPAIDAGNPTGCTDGLGHLLKTDQRGDPRPNKEDSGGCDIGAYESQRD